jgi:NCAIR mutase (PurE)-related protein
LDYIEKIDNFAQLDIFRQERKGIPEVIFAQSKSVEMIIEIIDKMLAKKDFILISRIREDQFPKIEEYVKSNPNYTMDLNKRARIAKIYKRGTEKTHQSIRVSK